jgi:hypothetical protein
MSKNLEPGTAIPDFELADETGQMHRLSELQGENHLVLHLSRGEQEPTGRFSPMRASRRSGISTSTSTRTLTMTTPAFPTR